MSTAVRVAGFVAGLVTVFGVAWAAGAAVGPVADDPAPMAEHEMAETAHVEGSHDLPDDLPDDRPGGLAVAEAGHRLVLADDVLRPGAQELAFTIEGPDGAPVTAYDVEHEKRLHLIVVRRDFSRFQHLHPELDEATGEWSTEAALQPGAWRVFADFVPTGGEDLTLGADLQVPGAATAPRPVEEVRTDRVGQYTVSVDGDLHPGETSMLTFEIERDGVPVETETYLGAAGHVVALRSGDLAYLHVHPGDGLEFGAEVPSAGTYHLFLDFQHDGVVHTAELVLEAS